MPKDSFERELGRLIGAMEAVTKATNDNTAEIRHVNAYMNKTIGATEERDKHYKRVKHTAIGSLILSAGSLIKVLLGHS